jgi:prepilin-type N-terminal cleavage/methylation domain-containing protein
MKNNSIEFDRADGRGGDDSGFTVIELAVSVVIFSIVMGSVYALVEVGRSSRLNTTQRSEILQNMRIALNTMGRDALNSGVGYDNVGALIPDDGLTLLGLAADGDGAADHLTPVYAGNNLNVISGTQTDQVSFAFIDDVFNGSVSVPVTQLTSTTSGIELTMDTRGPDGIADTADDINNGVCTIGDVFVISSQNGSALGQLTGKTGSTRLLLLTTDPLRINAPGGASPIETVLPAGASCGGTCVQTTGSLYKVNWMTYRVIDDGTGTGTLVRHVYGGRDPLTDSATAGSDQPLAFGVENMQIVYVLESGDVRDAPAATDMQDIRQVRVSVSVRSPELDRRTNQPFRSMLSASFSTRNLVYEKQ